MGEKRNMPGVTVMNYTSYGLSEQKTYKVNRNDNDIN